MDLQKLLHLCFSLFNLLLNTGYEYGGGGGVVQDSSLSYDQQNNNNNNDNDSSCKQIYDPPTIISSRKRQKVLMMVFGDSYADTGNSDRSESISWRIPYGITFPGQPSGRFSDGRLLTDYLATLLGIVSPIPYQWRKHAKRDRLQYGMNFAYAGTGVFDTLAVGPNMTTQIDLLDQLMVNDSVYSKADLESSIVLLTLSGNDYGAFYAKGGTRQGLRLFIERVINQLEVNLRRIEATGAKKILVGGAPPLGCLPDLAAPYSYKQCNQSANTDIQFHNFLLRRTVEKLNHEAKSRRRGSSSVFTILDLYTSFTAILHPKAQPPGNYFKFETPLVPCCIGTSDEFNCGEASGEEVELYTVCDNPDSAFFWDRFHPTQAGWHAVSSFLMTTLHHINFFDA